MDILFGSMCFDANGVTTPVRSATEFHNGKLDLYVDRIHNFNSDTKGFFYDKQSGVFCAAIGYISNLDFLKDKYNVICETDVEVIVELYSREKFRFIPELQGLFTIFLFTEKSQRGYILQGPYGHQLAVYYMRKDNRFFFSTSLKQLLKRTHCERVLNASAVSDLFYYRFFLPNDVTLLKGVRKIVPKQHLVVDCARGSIKSETFKRRRESTSQDTAKKRLITSIQEEVSRIASQLRQQHAMALTLSGGYDTNLLLHTLATTTQAFLTAYTMGGKETNEIPTAQTILENYSDVKHVVHLIDENALELLPKIVWRLEGAVVERGVFLQYELARLVAEDYHTILFVGDCADQQLRGGSHYSAKRGVKQRMKETLIGDLYRVLTNRRVGLNYSGTMDYIQKKGGIMLNSFGIQSLYPFLNEEIEQLSLALGKLNILKRFYKEEVARTVGSQVAECLEKQGGSTDIEYLFDARKDLVVRIVNSESVGAMLRDARVHLTSDRMNCSVALTLLYLYLFKRLFVDCDHDVACEQEDLGIPLCEFA